MAGRNISTNIELKGAAQFQREMNQCASSMKNLNSESKLIEAQFKATGDQETYFSQKCENLAKRFEVQRKEIEIAQRALADLRSKGYSETSREVQRFQQQLISAQTGMYNIQAEINATGQELEAAGYKFTWLGDTAQEATEDIAKVGGSFDTGGVTGSAGEVGKAVEGADDSASGAAEEIAKVGGSFDTAGAAGSAGDVGKAVEGADDSASTVKGAIAGIGGSFATTGVEGSAGDVSSYIDAADNNASGVKATIAAIGGSFSTSGVEGSAGDVSSYIEAADNNAADVKSAIAGIGGSFATTGVEGSAGDVSSYIEAADNNAADVKSAIAGIGGSFATTGAQESAGDVSSYITAADDNASGVKATIAAIGSSFSTSGVEGSAGDVSSYIEAADDNASTVKGAIAGIGGSFATSGVEGSAGDVSSYITAADDNASTVKGAIAGIGDSFATTGVQESAGDVSSYVGAADDNASTVKTAIAGIGGSFSTSGVAGSAEDVNSDIGSADDNVSDVKSSIASVGNGFATTGVAGSAGDVDSAVAGAGESAGSAKADIDSVGASFDATGATGSAGTVKSALFTLEKQAEAADADLNSAGEGFDSGASSDAGTIAGELASVESGAASAKSSLDTVGTAITVTSVLDSLKSIEDGLSSLISRAAQGVKAIADLGGDAGSWADDLLTESQVYNLDPTTIQQMRYASKFFDTEVSDIEGSMTRLTQKMDDARGGNKEMIKSFQQMGVEYKNQDGTLRNTVDVFDDIIRAMGKIENQADREAMAQNMMGRSANSLNPLIKNFDEYKEKMAQAPVVAEEQVNALGAVKDAYDDLDSQLEVTKMQVMAELAPAFQAGAEALSGFVEQFREFVSSEEGKQALDNITEAMLNLINSFTGEDNIQGVFTAIETAINAINEAFKWISENSESVIKAIEAIGVAFTTIKLSEGMLTLLKLGSGLKGLLGGNGAGSVPGASGGAGDALGRSAPAVGSALSKLASLVAPALPYVAFGTTVYGLSRFIDERATERRFGDYKRNRDSGAFEKTLEGAGEEMKELEAQREEINSLKEEIKRMQAGEGTKEEIKNLQETLESKGFSVGEKGIDGIIGDDTTAAMNDFVASSEQALAQIDALSAKQAEIDRLKDLLAAAFDTSEAMESMDMPEYMQTTKEFMEQYAEELKNVIPEFDFWGQLEDAFGTESPDWEQVIQAPAFRETMTTLMTDLTNALYEAVQNAETEAQAAGEQVGGAAGTGAEEKATTGGETAGSALDTAMAQGIEANEGVVLEAADRMADAAIARLHERIASADLTLNAPATRPGSGNTSTGANGARSSGGGGQAKVVLNVDGREFAHATVDLYNQELGIKEKLR